MNFCADGSTEQLLRAILEWKVERAAHRAEKLASSAVHEADIFEEATKEHVEVVNIYTEEFSRRRRLALQKPATGSR